MLRQVYEYRIRGYSTAQHEMTIRRSNEKFSKRDESGRLIHPLRQKQFEEYMKHADEVAKKWL